MYQYCSSILPWKIFPGLRCESEGRLARKEEKDTKYFWQGGLGENEVSIARRFPPGCVPALFQRRVSLVNF